MIKIILTFALTKNYKNDKCAHPLIKQYLMRNKGLHNLGGLICDHITKQRLILMVYRRFGHKIHNKNKITKRL